jgi:hypothetical protein
MTRVRPSWLGSQPCVVTPARRSVRADGAVPGTLHAPPAQTGLSYPEKRQTGLSYLEKRP